jgi:hypothetical protein
MKPSFLENIKFHLGKKKEIYPYKSNGDKCWTKDLTECIKPLINLNSYLIKYENFFDRNFHLLLLLSFLFVFFVTIHDRINIVHFD